MKLDEASEGKAELGVTQANASAKGESELIWCLYSPKNPTKTFAQAGSVLAAESPPRPCIFSLNAEEHAVGKGACSPREREKLVAPLIIPKLVAHPPGSIWSPPFE